MSSDTKRLELSVSNFGPVAEARIEMRPLTIFVGPSNTGKSYLASLIYSLHNSLNGFYGQPRNWPFLPEQFWAGRLKEMQSQSYSLTEESAREIMNWFGEAKDGVLFSEEEETGLLELPEHVSALVRPLLGDEFIFGANLDAEIARCFGVDKTVDLCRYGRGLDTQFNLQGFLPSEVNESSAFSYNFSLTEQGAEMRASIPEEPLLQADVRNFRENFRFHWLREEHWPEDVPEIIFGSVQLLIALSRAVFSGLVDPVSRPAYYLPAGRAGVMHAHQVVVRSLIAGASRAALRPDPNIAVLSGVLGDFLDQLVSLASRSPDANEDFAVLAQGLENSMIKGSVYVDRSPNIDYPSFSYRPEGWDRNLPLMNTSSMVSELAPVVLYLRHLVKEGDLLIVEEPEAHLHPEMQAVFTRQLVSAVQSGVRILFTTHSEWILEELANLVRLSELPNESREGIESPEVAIGPDQLGAWFFEPSDEAGGSVVREITLDEELATLPAGFGRVTQELYNRWVEISTRIDEGGK